jgi:tripartite-type tricarboxylate transporter receptor subunit TctC
VCPSSPEFRQEPEAGCATVPPIVASSHPGSRRSRPFAYPHWAEADCRCAAFSYSEGGSVHEGRQFCRFQEVTPAAHVGYRVRHVSGRGATACPLIEEDEDFPTQRIEIIVPWSAGGGTDQTARQLADQAEATCGTDIIVVNREGAGGAIGHQAMADAEADGYTVGAATIEVTILNHLDAADVTPDDLHGVMRYSANPAVLSVPADSPYESLDDLIEAMEAGEQVRIATIGTGGIWDIAAGGFGQAVGVEFTERVPYDGGADMIAAALGGHVEALAPSGAESIDQIEAGDLRPLVTMAEERLDVLPDTPTTVELGIDWTAANWFGLVVPAGTPDERIQVLSDCFTEAFESEAFAEFMEAQGFGMEYLPASEFEHFMDDEFERYGALMEEIY